MFNFAQSDSFARNLILSGITAVLIAGCGDSGVTTVGEGQSQYEVEDDHAIGNPDAAVTVVEYASVVCGACGNWHNTVYGDFKQKYIDTGKVRFVFREFPTAPENLARAGFLIANCADESKFFENISLQFKRQQAILTSPDKRQEYVNIAKAAGLSEADFEACMQNEEENARYDRVVQSGIDAGVQSTPSFFINGQLMRRTPSGKPVFSLEAFDEILIPLLGDDAPAAKVDAVTEPEPTEQ